MFLTLNFIKIIIIIVIIKKKLVIAVYRWTKAPPPSADACCWQRRRLRGPYREGAPAPDSITGNVAASLVTCADDPESSYSFQDRPFRAQPYPALAPTNLQVAQERKAKTREKKTSKINYNCWLENVWLVGDFIFVAFLRDTNFSRTFFFCNKINKNIHTRLAYSNTKANSITISLAL